MGNSKDPVIWIVEDDPSVMRLISENLKAHHFQPVSFNNAEKAYAALQSSELPAMIILDILLPGMSGVDLIRLLKQNKDWTRVPVVVVSVLTHEDAVVHSKTTEIFATYWMNKPFEPDALIRTIQDILSAVR